MLREVESRARVSSSVADLVQDQQAARSGDVSIAPVRSQDKAAEAAVRELLTALGVDVSVDEVMDTPRRVAAMYGELLTPIPFNLTTFENTEGYDELVLVRDIPFVSLCAHHLLPFTGHAHVAYVPGERIVGLSKIARLVHHLARALQLQERLTKQIAVSSRASLLPRASVSWS